MHISSSDTVVGYPILTIRSLLKKCQREDLVAGDVERTLHIEEAEAKRVLAVLAAEGFIERIPQFSHEQWRTTLQGNKLANASAAKPTTRTKAAQTLAEFIARVEEINADDRYVYRVKQVILFGSYLTESPTVNDVDLAVSLESKYSGDEWDTRTEQRIREAIAGGRRFSNITEQVVWPYTEVLLFLKHHSRLISLHEVSDVEALNVPTRVIFGEYEAKPKTRRRKKSVPSKA